MIREFENVLLNWKNNGCSKPLMVVGARQIGKTFTILKFCQENFKQYIYINLEKEEPIRQIFEDSLDPSYILQQIEVILEKSISIDETVLFFDEVQVSERFITSLKYFCESEHPYKVVCAGSLLGVKINRFSSSFPVGKIDLEYMFPMNFKEFLNACGLDKLILTIEEHFQTMEAMPSFLHEKALTYYKYYLLVGGMPEAVKSFVENGSNIMSFDRSILSSILQMYLNDMNKYTFNKAESVKVEKVYQSIPRQLGKENHKFQYKFVEVNGSRRKFESALDWLLSSSLIINCFNVAKIEIPLKAYQIDNDFKVYLNDVGLLCSMCELRVSDIMNEEKFMFNGFIAENFVANELHKNGYSLYYWRGATSEIDFLLTLDDGIIPVEVKSSLRTQSKSLNVFLEKYRSPYGIRISMKNFGYENSIKSIPLYATFCFKKND